MKLHDFMLAAEANWFTGLREIDLFFFFFLKPNMEQLFNFKKKYIDLHVTFY